MRNGGDVLDHVDLEASGLQSADSGFTALAGALDVHFDGLQAMLHSSLGSRLGSHLSGEGSGLSGTAEAQTTGGSPGQSIALEVGDGNHGVVEGGADMRGTLLDVLTLAASLDDLLSSSGFSHDISLLYFFLLAMVFLGPLRVRALVLVR